MAAPEAETASTPNCMRCPGSRQGEGYLTQIRKKGQDWKYAKLGTDNL